MRWVLYAGGALVLLGMAVAVIGAMLPEAHTVSRTARVGMPPEAVYALLTDVAHYRDWRPDVKSLERLPDRDGKPAWVEESGGTKIPMHFERMDRPLLLVGRIGDGLAFGGTWTYRIVGAPGGSEVTITEDGEIYNPIFRFMARFVFGYSASLDGMIKNLQARAETASRARD